MRLSPVQPESKRWSREEYYRLSEDGWFDGQRVQLIDGEIIQMPPQGHEHAKSLFVLRRFLQSVFVGDFWIREEKPLNVGRRSDPEPDLAVVEGLPPMYNDHPTTALVVIEVADSSLRLDRRKAALYAKAKVDEYWIVNLPDRKLEVYREVVRDKTATYGYRYRMADELLPGDKAALALRPKTGLAVKELFA
jgi:Uma2 family endonuclease